MALESRELFGSVVTQATNLRAQPYEGGIRPGTLASISGAPVLPNLTPLAYDEGNDVWAVFADDVTAEVFVLTADGTPASAGDFTLSIDGETATVAFDATAAEVVTALEGMSNVAPGDVTGVDTVATDLGDANHVVTLTFAGAYAGTPLAMTADFTGISAGNDPVLTNTATGAGAATNQVDGLLWIPESVGFTASATGELTIQVFRRGQVHHDDIPLPTTSSQTQNGLTAALQDTNRMRTLGIDIQGISGIH